MELLREIAFSKRIEEKRAGDLKTGDIVSDRGRIVEMVERGQNGYLWVLRFYDGSRGAVSKNSMVEVIV